MTFDAAAARIAQGSALDAADALALSAHPNLTELGMLAHLVRLRRHPDTVTYSAGWTAAFSDRPESTGAGLWTTDSLQNQAARFARAGGSELGLFADPERRPPLTAWEELLGRLSNSAGTAALTLGVSGAEVLRLSRSEEMPAQRILERLRRAGLKMMRAEEIGPSGATAAGEPPNLPLAAVLVSDELLAAAAAGVPVTASLPRGIDSADSLAASLIELRQIQERTGIIRAFVTGPVGRRNTERPLEPDSTGVARWSSYRYLRFLAVARCVLDNVPHFQSAWEDQGAKIGQVGLRCGADDFGSACYVPGALGQASGGAAWIIPPDEIERLIRDTGLKPVRRNGLYEEVAAVPYTFGLPLLQSRTERG